MYLDLRRAKIIDSISLKIDTHTHFCPFANEYQLNVHLHEVTGGEQQKKN